MGGSSSIADKADSKEIDLDQHREDVMSRQLALLHATNPYLGLLKSPIILLPMIKQFEALGFVGPFGSNAIEKQWRRLQLLRRAREEKAKVGEEERAAANELRHMLQATCLRVPEPAYRIIPPKNTTPQLWRLMLLTGTVNWNEDERVWKLQTYREYVKRFRKEIGVIRSAHNLMACCAGEERKQREALLNHYIQCLINRSASVSDSVTKCDEARAAVLAAVPV